jgi:two-component system, OmpR family, phosphate regulon response regulator PhoB
LARKILLADDSVTAQNMGRKILADAGYEVIAVNNGSAALKKIAELKPDLVILDVYMPGYSGLEVCQRLKESQDTARIPVLLTVGKLEPFKPEESQRVRAEGYIVKPFEASELLSALSKLEDKVVPRPEPSKPGRFARAMKAADETDRGAKNEPSSTEIGWKNRINFPREKSEAEEPVAQVDVAAFAPIGVPKGVSPAEVAAITAAAAQIQMAEAITKDKDEDRSSDSASHPSVLQVPTEFSVEPVAERFEQDDPNRDNVARVTRPSDAEVSISQPSQEGIAGELPAANLDRRRNGDEKLEEPQDAPVTMAIASDSASDAIAALPRWTAVPVALENDEASVSLEHEMQKAYAAFAAADYATSAGSAEAASSEVASASPQATTEPRSSSTVVQEPVAAISSSEAATGSEPQPLPVRAPDFAAPVENLLPSAELASSAGTLEAATAAPAEQVASAAEPTPRNETASVSTDSLAPVADNSGLNPDSDTLKTTAAAWASWRQIRDTDKNDRNEEPERQLKESLSSEPTFADNAALAVAAGAEQSSQDLSAAKSDTPSDVASIVDSVLAGLRPKLMEEITRKMAEKK